MKVKKNKQNRQNKQNKGKGKGNKKQGQRQRGPEPQAGVFEPRVPLDKRSFKKAVQAAVKFQMRPALREANRTINDIQGQQGYQLQKESLRGQQAVGNIGAYYQKLAQDEAASLASRQATGDAYTGSVAQSGKDTLAAIQAAGATAQGGINTPEGQAQNTPTQAKDRLASMIAEQGSQAAREGAAFNAEAQGQSKASMDLMSMLAASTGMHGGEQVSDATRSIQNAIGEIRNTYGQQLSKAQNAKLELLMQRPEIARQTLLEMRKGEREYIQGNQALGIEKSKLKGEREGKTGGIAYSRENLKNQLKYLKAKKQARLNEMDKQNASEKEKREEEHRFREKEMAAQETYRKNKRRNRKKEIGELPKGGKGNGEGKFMDEGWQTKKKGMSILRRNPSTPKDLAYGGEFKGKYRSAKEVRTKVKDELVANGVDPDLANVLIKQYIKKWKTPSRQSRREHAGKIPGAGLRE